MKADVFDIYRGTTHDGPGLRTTIFFRGCPLQCSWCHNPEGIRAAPAVWWDERKCIGCSSCVKCCPQGALAFTADGLELSETVCIGCGACAKSCPSKALEQISHLYTVDELMAEVMKGRAYFEQFGGGVTLSGGEALLQADFAVQLLRRLKKENIHTAVDTCGQVPFAVFEKVLPFTDCVLYDLKIRDSQAHFECTGCHNEKILSNFTKLMEAIQRGTYHTDVWIRTPLIPGKTATEENIRQIAKLIKSHLGKEISRWELCAFNNACTKKYRKLGKSWAFESVGHMTVSEVESLKAAAIAEGLEEMYILVSGIMA